MSFSRLGRVVSLLLLAALPLAACAAGGPAAAPATGEGEVEVSFRGYAAGSSTQLRADALAEAVRLEHPEWKVSSMASGGEARLISDRIAGEVDFFYTQSTRVLELELQQPLHPGLDFAEAAAYCLVMPASLLYVHFFAREDAPVDTPREIVDSRYPYRAGVGSGVSRLLLDKVLGYYGASIEAAESWGASHETVVIASAEGAEALQSGRIDIGFGWTSVPNAQFLGGELDVKLLPVSDPGLVDMFRDLGCVTSVIRGGAYAFVPADVPTVAAPQHLAVRAGMPDDVVYEVVKAVHTHREILFAAHAESRVHFSPAGVAAAVSACDASGDVFHPGALRFYREMGWLT